jgi:predicted amidohydrolase YtcJ
MGGRAAETVLIGNVLTLDRAGTVAEAVAISGGRIRATGQRAAIMELCGPGT